MPFAAAGDIRLHYELRGRGLLLLYISGTAADLRRPANALERGLAERCETLCFDQRGMGRSDKPDRPCTMADYADDAARLLDAVGWPRAAVLGYSFGGMVAQELALRHPARLTRLVLVSTTAGGAGGGSYPVHEWSRLAPRERALRWVLQTDLRRDAAWQAANPELMAALWEAQTEAMTLTEADAASRIGARRQLAARQGHDTWDRLPELRMPVQVFAGRHDGIAPLDAQRRLAQRIPGARFTAFDGGHLFFLQSAAARAAILTAATGESAPPSAA